MECYHCIVSSYINRLPSPHTTIHTKRLALLISDLQVDPAAKKTICVRGTKGICIVQGENSKLVALLQLIDHFLYSPNFVI